MRLSTPRLRLLAAALLTGLVAHGSSLTASAAAGTPGGGSGPAGAGASVASASAGNQGPAASGDERATSALVVGARPRPPAGGHDATLPWVTRPVADAMAAAPVGRLQPRAAVRPLRARPAAVPGRPATAGGPALKREVFGFANAGSVGDPGVGYTTWNFSLLSTVAYFGLHVNAADGSLVTNDTGWNVWHSSIASGLINTAHAAGVRVVLTVIYQDTGPGMCSALDHGATTAGQVRQQLLGADGVNIDYEGVNLSCPDGVSLRTKVVQFTQAMRGAGLGYLSIDTYASSAEDAGGFFDVPSLAGTVDTLFVMDYGLETPNGPCATCMGPTSPLRGAPTYVWNVARSAADYAPYAGQAILGFPYYGVKGCVAGPNPPPNAPVTGSYGADPYATIVTYPSNPAVTSWSEQRDALDPTGEEPWASFQSAIANCWREEYWDDAVSLGHKYDLVNQLGYRGAGIFTLDYGGGAPELWNALQGHFALVPGAPAAVTACPGNGFATVSWSAPASPSPITGYTITVSPGGATVHAAGGATFATVPGLANGTAYAFTVTAANGSGAGPASASSAAVTPGPAPGSWPGRLHPLTPARILDTRAHLGYPAPLGPGTRADVPVLGQGGVPASGVSAVVLNLTAVDQTQGSFLTVSAGGACVLGFSNLNFAPGGAAANLTVVPVGAGGSVSVFNASGSVDVVADVFGWFGGAGDTGPAGHLTPVSPTRILDTRLGTQGIRTLGPHQTAVLSVAGQNGLPASGIGAVALNLTATDTTAATWLNVWPDGQPQPLTSNLNLGPGETRANRVIVPVGADGKIDLFNVSGSADAIVDVTGWFTDGTGAVSTGLYTGVDPVRALDSRIGLGGAQAPLGPGQWLTVTVAGQPGLPASGISGVVVNLTVTNPGRPSFLEVNQSGQYTGTSDVNFVAGQTIPNLVVTPVDASGRIHVFNASGSTDVIVDVLGWF
jgi:Fibronectin type III domain/Glycosyl hydrolases family 18